MRRIDRTLPAAALLLAFFASAPLAAQEHEHSMGDSRESAAAMTMEVQHNRHFLVSTEWLAANLTAPNLVLVHVGRSDAAWRTGHIPGARFLPLEAVAGPANGLQNEFPPPDRMAAAFRDLGITDDSRIILVGDDPGLYAARAWAALDLLGRADSAALLDGGATRWAAESRPVDTARPRVRRGRFTVRLQPERIVTAAWVRSHLGDSTVLLVDARSPDQFAGTDAAAAGAARSGHLPGARNLPWMNALLSREDPTLHPMHMLHHETWAAAGAGNPAVRTIVTYCRSGMQASHLYFVARYIGYPDVRLYDGSFAEWSALDPAAYPVETGAGR